MAIQEANSPIRAAGARVRVMRPGERRSVSRSATRALDVMELFGSARAPLRAVEIGKALEMNPSTTNQLLKTMVGSGHLVFDARTKRYLPSPRLAEFSGWIVETYGAGGRLRDLICGIRDDTGLVITVTTPNDLFMQIVDSAIPHGQMAERGLRISVFGSVIGSAYLSMLDDAEVSRLAYRARVPEKEWRAVLEAAADVRHRGFAEGASGDGAIWSIAMPLPARCVPMPAVLGAAGPADQVRERVPEIAAVMQAAIKSF